MVIAIIGILTIGTFYFLNDARIRARDARRVADLKEIANALEIYYGIYGQYPDKIYLSHKNNWMEQLRKTGLMPVPIVDPVNNIIATGEITNGCGGAYVYIYTPHGEGYKMCAVQEKSGYNDCHPQSPSLGGQEGNKFHYCIIR